MLIIWVAQAYNAAPAIDLWLPPTALRHLSLTLMPFACIFVVAGLTTPSPAAVSLNSQALTARGPSGIQNVTRHPVMWGFALWGIAHLLANGDAANVLLFGGLITLALLGARHIDAKKRRSMGEAWQPFATATSFLPFAAIAAGHARFRASEIGWWRIVLGVTLYGLLVWAHPLLFGVDVWPL